MSPALTVSEFRTLVGLLGSPDERKEIGERNMLNIDRLDQLGLARWSLPGATPQLTDRGRALLGYMRALPLPVPKTIVWTLPAYAPECVPTTAVGDPTPE